MYRVRGGNAGKCNMSVPAGRENNNDSGSSGERTRRSLNPFSVKRAGVAVGVLWGVHGPVQHDWAVVVCVWSNLVGDRTGVGESPVGETWILLQCACARVARNSWNFV